jgi:hypothetical protein
MRNAAMTTRDRASLFLDDVVGSSSSCRDTVATCDKLDRLLELSKTPLRLSGLASDDMLGERDNGRGAGRGKAPFAEGGLASVSKEIDFRCPRVG